MLSLEGIPRSIAAALAPYRHVFCRDAGFNNSRRYISGLLLSPNKTLQGIYSQVVWPQDERVTRRAMHKSV